MIPVRLQMHNFLSYGENAPVLDFSQFNIACLSGRNGQGKSALLDALTWAIWGEGRKPSQERKADSGLVRIGQTEMWVDLILDLEGERYRIIRKFSKAKKRYYSELEFQVFDEDKSAYISLASSSIAQTQQKINHLLRMDYQTFIHSAFILQGRVDEFTRKNARDRKKILSDILGLSRYEQLSTLARQYLRDTEKELQQLEAQRKKLNQEVSQKKYWEKENQSLSQEIGKLKERIKKTKKELDQLQDKLNKLFYQKENKKSLDNRIKETQNQITESQNRIKKMNTMMQEFELMIDKKAKIWHDYHQYQALNQENKRLISLMQTYQQMEKEKRESEQQIEQARNALKVKLAQKKNYHQALQEKVQRLKAFQKEQQALNLKMTALNRLSEKQSLVQQQGNEIKLSLENTESQIKQLKKEIIKNKEKDDFLNQSRQAECPLCHSPLDATKKKRIQRQISQDLNEQKRQIEVWQKEMTQMRQKRAALAYEWKQLQQKLSDKEKLQNRLNALSLALEEKESVYHQKKAVVQAIEELQQSIENNQFAQQERKALEQINRKMKDLGYNDQSYLKVHKQLEELKDAPLKKAKLLQAQQSLQDLQNEKINLDNQIEIKKNVLTQLQKENVKITQETTDIPLLNKKITTLQKYLKELQTKQNQIFQRQGVCQEKLNQIDLSYRVLQDLSSTWKKQKSQIKIYKMLVIAFGRNGIPALIIENAIPEIEEKANHILSRLSPEKINISIESLKDLKSGGIRETLDIKIHDEMGTRPYELYSGGEAFRIDFAIRIPISELLTHRAGARLRTLIIDEGFGTQDEESLQRLVQAIHAIQSDFEKILVITHLAPLKEAFPVRIEVWKDPTLGSQFEVIY